MFTSPEYVYCVLGRSTRVTLGTPRVVPHSPLSAGVPTPASPFTDGARARPRSPRPAPSLRSDAARHGLDAPVRPAHGAGSRPERTEQEPAVGEGGERRRRAHGIE